MGQELNTYNQRLDRAIRELDDIRDISVIVGRSLFASKTAISGYQYVNKTSNQASEGLTAVDLALGALKFVTPLKTPVNLLKPGVKRAEKFLKDLTKKQDEINEKKDVNAPAGEEGTSLLDQVKKTIGIATLTNDVVQDGLTLRIQQLETAKEATNNFKAAITVAMEGGGVAWQGKYNALNMGIEAQLALRNAETDETNDETSVVKGKFDDLTVIFEEIDFPTINKGILALEEFSKYFAAFAKPLDVAATLLEPVQPLFDAADLIVSLFVDPVVDFILDELGMRPLLDVANELVDLLTVDYTGMFDDMARLLQIYKDTILDLAETGLGMIPLLDLIEEAHFGGVVGEADRGPTGWGTALGQTVEGDSGDDILDGLGGDDTIRGGAGNDVIIGGEGSDLLEGGTGDDLFYFDASFTEYELMREEGTDNIHVSHILPRAGGFNTGIDIISNIEDGDHVVFTDISFTGEELRDAIFGGSILDGTNGDDLMFLSSTGVLVNGYYVANGLGGDDKIFGSTEGDHLSGGRGNDLLLPGKGNDLVAGDAGIDTYQILEGENSRQTIDLVEGTAFGQGQDLLSSIENIIASPNQDHYIRGTNGANNIFTGDGIDVLSGRAGDDVIHAGGEDDFIIGGAGADTINAGGADRWNVMLSGSAAVSGVSDLYIGGVGRDMVSYTSEVNTIRDDVINHTDDPSIYQRFKEAMSEVTESGPVKIDAATGEITRYDLDGNEITVDRTQDVEGFMGSDMEDLVYGAATATYIHGGGGDDEIWTGGTQNIDGGLGDDVIFAQSVEEGSTALQVEGGGGFDILDLAGVGDARWFYKIEDSISLQLKAFDVTTEGENLQNEGNAFFSLKPRGVEEIIFGDNADHISFRRSGGAEAIFRLGDGDDRFDGRGGEAEVFAGDGNDKGNFSSGGGIFHGEGGDDFAQFSSSGANHEANMGDGNDYLEIGRFEGFADGGDGYDSIAFDVGFSSRIVVDTTAGTADSFRGTSINGVNQVEMTLTNFEELIATEFNDTVKGNETAEVFVGRTGNDDMDGRQGDDKLYGGAGNDKLVGGDDDDLLHGGAGNDRLFGGSGRDTASYTWAAQDGLEGELTAGNFGSVSVDLRSGIATGAFGTDELVSIENVIGTGANDTLFGDDNDNLLSGGDGDDGLFGEGGDDLILTGDGDDEVEGGDGDDTVLVGLGVKTLQGGDGRDTLDFGTLDGSMMLDFGAGSYSASFVTEIPQWLERDLDGDGSEESDGFEARLINGVMMTPQDVLETNAAFANSADDLTRELPEEGEEGFEASLVQLIDVERSAFGTFESFEEVLGGRSADHMIGDSRDNKLSGSLGEDILEGKDGADALSGGFGADTIYGGLGYDEIDGGDGFDTIYAGFGFDTVFGGNGRDTVYLGLGNDVFNDTSQNDENGADTVYGGAGNDIINAGGGADKAYGGAGDDEISGGFGADEVYGGTGSDTIRTGFGFDKVWGGDGRDTVYLGSGDDVFNDTSQNNANGEDTVFAGTGNDRINGGGGADEFHGGAGMDTIIGGFGADKIYGGAGFDTVYAGDGFDTVFGGNGRDTVYLGRGNDVFRDDGQNDANGADRVFAGEGADTIIAGGGNNVFTGGLGADIFSFNTSVALGDNSITDFSRGEDVLEMAGVSFADLTQVATGSGVRVEWDGGSVTLDGVGSAAISQDDFVFV